MKTGNNAASSALLNPFDFGNCGYTQETAEAAIRNGHADLISFGRPFISNPDWWNGLPMAGP